MIILNELNNREIASIIWIILFAIYALTITKVRQSIPDLLKAFFHRKLIFPIIAMLIYILGMVVLLNMIGFWDLSALKDTILWTIGTAFLTFFNLDKVGQEEKYFTNIIVENIKFIVILEFITNLYTFSLLTELLVLPIIGILLFMKNIVAELKPELKQVEKVLIIFLAVFGILILVFTAKEIYLDFQSFASIKNLRDLLLPPLLLLMLIPFVYFIALYMQYVRLFNLISFANEKSDLSKYANRMVLATCHINLFMLIKVSKKAGFPKVSDKKDVLDWINMNDV